MRLFTTAFILIAACAMFTGADAKNTHATPRSTAARHAFVKQQACPATGKHRLPGPGYVIDHITPLACHGSDTPSNMQWQTKTQAKDKDKWERKGCAPKPRNR